MRWDFGDELKIDAGKAVFRLKFFKDASRSFLVLGRLDLDLICRSSDNFKMRVTDCETDAPVDPAQRAVEINEGKVEPGGCPNCN